MKATVWTSRNPYANSEAGKPKCIFSGNIAFPPSVDDHIQVRAGFAALRVLSVIHDFLENSIEIQVHTYDSENEYGPGLDPSLDME